MKKVGLFAAAMVTLAGAAHAQSPDADELIRRGNELRRKGADEAALHEFRRAYDLGATPRAAAQLGLAEQQVRHWGDSERHLSQALRDKVDPWVNKNRAVLEKSAKFVRAQIGRLEVTGEPAGAEVLINTENVGTLPLPDPVPVTPGPVRVEVRAAGYLSGAMSLDVTRGQLGKVNIRLERDARAANVDPPGFDPSKAAAKAAVQPQEAMTVHETPEPPPEKPEEPRTGDGLRTARWVTVGAGGVLLAAGVAGALIDYTKIQSFNRDCGTDPKTGRGVSKLTGAVDTTCEGYLDTAKTGKTVAIVGFAGAGLLAITSAILFFAF